MLCHAVIQKVRETPTDSTPYGLGETGWWGMCWWVFRANRQRLTFLSLIPDSWPASRFFLLNLLLFGFAVALYALPHVGWEVVFRDPLIESNQTAEPSGDGWARIVAIPDETPLRPGRMTAVSVWWNLSQAAIALPTIFAIALLAGWFLMKVICRGADRALRDPYAGQGRYQAAVRYSSAWVLPILLGAIIQLAVIVPNVGLVTHWSIAFPPVTVYAVAAVVLTVGLFLWWFWLLQAGATAPPVARTRVVTWFSLWTPVWALILFGGFGAALYFGLAGLMVSLGLQW